ncbi:MAG: hypothetical protein A3B23_01660 [Candidatus Colwellbacteria bacterium RIFCSPLOWO2_01_FULL_48_10]|uniref:DUF5667 domain-containing protein n=1 Tax=Candidatus Colwellbacteria bacterium RIFCSPLOWO2_01_FULL_48_10 TaxID=1797690 RepID=A0A1G1Z778_9BACT|nr:MAG: hypothetical protein A3B23_01660 [Candidatus Colwellbacteria bacterium RIFCSPLOWO2_01_FULL_48_10]
MTSTKNNIIRSATIVILVGLAAYFAVRFFWNSAPFIPPAFLEARARGSVLSENIIKLSQESLKNLEKISDADKAGDYSNGLNLVIGEISRNELARASALSLSNELEVMALKLGDVKPKAAMNVGLQAIIGQSQLVQRLINYNGYIYELLDVLRVRFSNKGASGAKEVADIIKQMNEESQSINDLNYKYRELMAKFDGLTRKEE